MKRNLRRFFLLITVFSLFSLFFTSQAFAATKHTTGVHPNSCGWETFASGDITSDINGNVLGSIELQDDWCGHRRAVACTSRSDVIGITASLFSYPGEQELAEFSVYWGPVCVSSGTINATSAYAYGSMGTYHDAGHGYTSVVW